MTIRPDLARQTPLLRHLIARRVWTPAATVFLRCTLPLYGSAGEFHKRHGHHARWAAAMLAAQRWLWHRRRPQRLVFDARTQLPRRTTLAEEARSLAHAFLVPALFRPVCRSEWWFIERKHRDTGNILPPDSFSA